MQDEWLDKAVLCPGDASPEGLIESLTKVVLTDYVADDQPIQEQDVISSHDDEIVQQAI